ncbi:hypothetical protein NDU88_001769 [Pleurodeles waltl]|uniref:Uncharacterized protein n=1 Tax=Pleurodeles waltl TaxID=8319 RepID=A0AAV7W184_PLEWA|nr:hypothetical protein NDU88_001769 [Pleurodeles waltl]
MSDPNHRTGPAERQLLKAYAAWKESRGATKHRGHHPAPPPVGVPQTWPTSVGIQRGGPQARHCLRTPCVSLSPYQRVASPLTPAASSSLPAQGNNSRQLRAACHRRIKDKFELLPCRA